MRGCIAVVVAAGVLAGASGSARADGDDDAPTLQARGEELARASRFGEAIEAFKAADHKVVRAAHACLIALAYTRLERWSQAELWLAVCHERAQPSDPMPDWVPDAEAQIAERLATANAAPIELRVDGVVGGAPIEITISSFAPDESIGPRTIHLTPGHYTLVARAKGYREVERAIDVADKTPQTIAIAMQPAVSIAPPPPPPPKPVVNAGWSTSKKLAMGGGVAIGLGVASYAVMGYAWSKLRDNEGFGGGPETMYDASRIATISLWALGAGALVGAVVLRDHGEVRVGAVPVRGGGVLAVEWTR